MFKKVAGFFVDLDEETSQEPVKEIPVNQPVVMSINPTTSHASMAVNGKIKETLSAELKQKISGSPYGQFQMISDGMASKIADPSTRTVATGASLEAQGITKQSIVESANTAISFLNSEAATFHAEISGEVTRLEQDAHLRTEQIGASLQEKQDQIKVLSEQISELQREKTTLEVTVAEKKSKLEVTKIEFDGALNSLLQDINGDVSDISRYMGA